MGRLASFLQGRRRRVVESIIFSGTEAARRVVMSLTAFALSSSSFHALRVFETSLPCASPPPGEWASGWGGGIRERDNRLTLLCHFFPG